jgi:hypothetical protein
VVEKLEDMYNWSIAPGLLFGGNATQKSVPTLVVDCVDPCGQNSRIIKTVIRIRFTSGVAFGRMARYEKYRLTVLLRDTGRQHQIFPFSLFAVYREAEN